jgi:hypothetical protein
MPRAGKARLERLEGRLEARLELPFEVKARNRRRELRWTANACAMIREMAEAGGIDPAAIGILRVGEHAAATLRGFADSPRLALADEKAGKIDDEAWIACHPGEPDPHEAMAAELERMAERYADGSAPEPDGAIGEWLAWAGLRQQAAAEESEATPPGPAI